MPRYDYVIDGSNVLLAIRLNRKPSVRALAAMLCVLEENNVKYKIWFDNSIYRHLEKAGVDAAEFNKVIDVLKKDGTVQFAGRADIDIQKDCKESDCPVINGRDKNDSWTIHHPPIFRCRIDKSSSIPVVYITKAWNTDRNKRTFTKNLRNSFNFRGLAFPSLAMDDATGTYDFDHIRMPKMVRKLNMGNLLVLLLDASQSMVRTFDTHDGRSRAAHVNEILNTSFQQLKQSSIASSLYLSVMVFSDDVQHLSPGGNGYIFSPINDWVKNPVDNYLEAVQSGMTNIRLSLDRATDHVDAVLQSEIANELARSWNDATIVMITDGEHYTKNSNDELETAEHIINHIHQTLSRPGQKVKFGFVGIGEGANHGYLTDWASGAEKEQIQRARNKDVSLVDGKLYVRTDTRTSNFQNIVRCFIDVASHRV